MRAMQQDPGSPAAGLAALEAQVVRDLALIEVPQRAWVPPRSGPDGAAMLDVVVVGAGLSGLSVAFGLRRQGVERVLVIDAAAEGAEGPWVTSARMRTLRSPKTLSGPDLGVPSLTYRAWHEAVHGTDDFALLDRIAREDWMAYLGWFRRVTKLRVQNGTRLTGLAGLDGGVTLRVLRGNEAAELHCRKVVLATGIEGAGGLSVPAAVTAAVPRSAWTHSGEVADVSRLRGLDVAVVGAAASAFDWAVTALDAGARQVVLLARSREMPVTEILDWSNFPGFLNHFAELDDRRRYRFTRRMFGFRTPPTQEMYDRARAHPAFRLLTGAPLDAVAMEGGRIALTVHGHGRLLVDHLLLGTGYAVDLARRTEFAGFHAAVARWRDRFVPDPGEEDDVLLDYPYLGPAFELTERAPGDAPFLRHIHLFNNGAVPSLGPVCNGITGLKAGVPKLVAGITRGLFTEDADWHFEALTRFDKAHFQPDAPPGPAPAPAAATAP
jgi:cation diffusion facilitator CzcD-associated flavoprotein CzcO